MATKRRGSTSVAKDPERSKAMKGNKNASKRIVAANIGGFLSGVLNPRSANERSLKRYQNYGAGTAGYKAGMLARRTLTLGMK